MIVKNIEQNPIEKGIDELIKPPITRLVNREKQIDAFAATLQNIQIEQRDKRFLEWSGSPGIGKTQLIRLLIEKVCFPQQVPYAFIDFNTPDAYRWAYDPTQLMLYVANTLQVDLNGLEDKVNSFQKLAPQAVRIPEVYLSLSRQERLYNRPEWLKSLQAVRDEFLVVLEKAQRVDENRHVVLFFDETEYADPDLVTWLEEWVFSPLMQADNYIIVWTARRQHRWTRPEVQRHILREQLHPFKENEVRDQFEASDLKPDLIDQFFHKALSITGGHPAANAVVIAQMQQDESTLGDVVNTSLEIELLKTIYEQFIRGRVLYGLRKEEKLACELLSLARFFDASILRRVLLQFNEKLFAEWSQDDFRILFERLKETQLLVWQNGFAIDSDFRHIIRDYYRVCKPGVFKQINEELVAIHKEWLERPVDNRSFFIIELLYHLTSLGLAGKRVQLKSAFQKQLRQYSIINDTEALRMALEKLVGEIENNTDDWLSDRQRKALMDAAHQFEKDNQVQQSTILSGPDEIQVDNVEE